MGRICEIFSTPWPPREGITNYVWNLSKQLRRRGNHVTMITRGPLLSSLHAVTEDLWAPAFVPAYPFHVQLHSKMVAKFLERRQERYDLFHCHSPLTIPPKSADRVLATFHTPMRVDVRHIEKNDVRAIASRLMLPFAEIAERTLIQRADVVSAVSEQTRRDLETYGLRGDQVSVIPNGVDTEIFRPNPASGGHRVILYVGRLDFRKGLFDLVETAKKVIDRHGEWRFVLVGHGPLKVQLERRRRRLGIQPSRFVLRGYVDQEELVRLYQSAELFVLPSHYEGMPGSLLEAMASGMTVVSTNVGGIPEIIQDGINGLLCLPRDPDSLASRLNLAIENEALRREIGQAARSTVQSRLSWSIVTDKLVSVANRAFPGLLA